ncbi:MAG: TetR/AcrR family transcriptional regulator [Clostridium sp.]|nr:TetR/AcrR family transcriptional regulator [Clostridium sp.]
MSKLTTKRAIGYAFKDLLKEKSFNKITITDIANKCAINRQTFYYHFQDIKDLVEWLCIDEVDNILNKNDECEKWEDKFLMIFEVVLNEKEVVENIYHSVSVEVLRTNLYRLVYPIIYSEIVEESKGKNLREEDKKFITDFYKYAFVSIVLDWIDKGMIENPEIIVLKVSNLITGTINHACLAVNE